jgi:hypothetical protein
MTTKRRVRPINTGAMATDNVIPILDTYRVIKGAKDVPRLIAANTKLASIPLPFIYTVLAEATPNVMMAECPKPAKPTAASDAATVFWGINIAIDTIAITDNPNMK